MEETARTFKLAVNHNDKSSNFFARFLEDILVSQVIKYELIPINWTNKLTNILHGKFDTVAFAFEISERRLKYLDYSFPIYFTKFTFLHKMPDILSTYGLLSIFSVTLWRFILLMLLVCLSAITIQGYGEMQLFKSLSKATWHVISGITGENDFDWYFV